jgi:hypothetical protein
MRYRLTSTYFFWVRNEFYLFPRRHQIIKTENHEKGFGIHWLWFLWEFEVV